MKHGLPLLSLVALLTACGGGGGGSDSTPDPAPVEGLTFTVPESLQSGDAVAIYGEVNGGADSQGLRYQWQQISGPDLAIANPRAPIAAFELPASGNYELSLTVTDSQGVVVSENARFSVAGDSDGLNIVRDHMVVEGNKVSLRVQSFFKPNSGENGGSWTLPANIQWIQTGGPAVTPQEGTTPELLAFNAPQVGKDTLLSFEASGTIDGQSVSDQAWVLVTNEQPWPDEFWLDGVAAGLQKPGFARVQAYRADSPWAGGLEKCLYDPQLEAPCKTSELPLIGQLVDEPTVDDIMDRVLVSHPWMGEQFEAFLTERDPNGDFRAMLAAVNGVVLSYDIRPSFYWVGTGAIYLDPRDLWRLPWQRDTINEAADFRSGFGNELQFLMPWRYVKDNQYASVRYPSTVRLERPWQDLEPDLASLLYHELAHANDFFPKNTQSSITGDTIVEEWDQRNFIVSDDLSQSYPLNSEAMRDLAQVSFRGEDADSGQKALLPSDITPLFAPDRASDYYSYSTIREDLAMLFEEAMMQHRYGIMRDVAVTGNRNENIELDLLVDWGQRGRVGEDNIAARLQLILRDILPGIDSNDLLQGLADPVPLRSGETWWDNLELASPGSLATQSLGTDAIRALRPGLVPHVHFGGRHPVQIPLPKQN